MENRNHRGSISVILIVALFLAVILLGLLGLESENRSNVKELGEVARGAHVRLDMMDRRVQVYSQEVKTCMKLMQAQAILTEDSPALAMPPAGLSTNAIDSVFKLEVEVTPPEEIPTPLPSKPIGEGSTPEELERCPCCCCCCQCGCQDGYEPAGLGTEYEVSRPRKSQR